jgi:hypothetical protein
MALRPDRDYNLIDDISHFWTDTAADAENGGVASMKTASSGVSLDNPADVVEYKADPSGAKPMGVLLQNVKHYAGTRVFPNMHNGEIQPGDKCTLVRKGWIVTNAISGTPTAGATAYLAENGDVSATQMTGAPSVGRFETAKDENGFAKLYIDL